jgi:hypothetical protein
LVLKRKISALDGAGQNMPSKSVAFTKSVPEVDEGESSEGETMEILMHAANTAVR